MLRCVLCVVAAVEDSSVTFFFRGLRKGSLGKKKEGRGGDSGSLLGVLTSLVDRAWVKWIKECLCVGVSKALF